MQQVSRGGFLEHSIADQTIRVSGARLQRIALCGEQSPEPFEWLRLSRHCEHEATAEPVIDKLASFAQYPSGQRLGDFVKRRFIQQS